MVLIDVIIKAPNQKLEDQTFKCDTEWTVKALKTHLSSVYPSKPRIEDQRLIYSGHLLTNEQSLREILQPIEDNLSFTIHLVCAQSSLPDSPKVVNNINNSTERMANNSNNTNNSNVNSNNNSTQSEPTNGNNSNTNGLGFQNPLSGQFSPNGVQNNLLNNPSVVIPPEQMWQQMALLQQAYNQYMAQYLSQNPYINQNIINNQTIPTTVPPIPAQQPIINAEPVEAIPAVNGIQAPQAVQRMNAGPGGQAVIDDDDDPRNRDWLDMFYWMSRAVVLFSIIYFYSSFTRFLLVVFLSVLLYLYQTNRFAPNPRNALPPNVHNNNNNEIAVNREEQERNGEVVPDETEAVERPRPPVPPQTNSSVLNAGRVTEERFTGLRFCWVIVSSLFTSLIPDNPALSLIHI